MTSLISSIAAKTGIPDLVDRLAGKLSGSDLNSLLLEVFNRSLKDMSPAELLRRYRANRFVQPAETDMIGLLKLELQTLEFLRDQHFQPIELSPAAQLGSCSVVAPADQKKIISATRHTEIMADATNSMALHIAAGKKRAHAPDQQRYCTVHRHIRTPEVTGKGHTQHFKVGCLVTSGRDTGSHAFECLALEEHIRALAALFEKIYGMSDLCFKLQKRGGYDDAGRLFDRVATHLRSTLPGSAIACDPSPSVNNYYKGIQYKMIIRSGDKELEIADGGFVDWSQQLLGNRKERLLITGFGLGLVYKMRTGEL